MFIISLLKHLYKYYTTYSSAKYTVGEEKLLLSYVQYLGTMN